VQSVNGAGLSAWAPRASARVPGQLPSTGATVLSAGTPTRSSIPLTWVSGATLQTGWQVQRATNAQFTGTAPLSNVNGATATTYTSSNLSRNTTYFYRVRATNAAGQSPTWSNPVSAKPLP
jgi:hypothetical protein